MDVAMDELGGIDFTRSTGMSMASQIKKRSFGLLV
jgi:hypothetical protein